MRLHTHPEQKYEKVFEKQTYFLKYFLFVENYLYPPSIISNFFEVWGGRGVRLAYLCSWTLPWQTNTAISWSKLTKVDGKKNTIKGAMNRLFIAHIKEVILRLVRDAHFYQTIGKLTWWNREYAELTWWNIQSHHSNMRREFVTNDLFWLLGDY